MYIFKCLILVGRKTAGRARPVLTLRPVKQQAAGAGLTAGRVIDGALSPRRHPHQPAQEERTIAEPRTGSERGYCACIVPMP